MLVYAGPFPETSQSNTHVLLVIDYFTKWVEAAPLQKKDPLSVAKALATIFYRWAPLLVVPWHLCSEMGRAGRCAAKQTSASTRSLLMRAGTLPATGETTPLLFTKDLCSCYQGRGEGGRRGSRSSPKES